MCSLPVHLLDRSDRHTDQDVRPFPAQGASECVSKCTQTILRCTFPGALLSGYQ